MGAVVSSVFGLLAGSAVVAGLSALAGVQQSWPVLLVGVLVGLIVRGLAATPRASYTRGALAALATVGAMIGGQVLAAQMIQARNVSGTTPAPSDAPAAEADAPVTDAESAPAETDSPLPTMTGEMPVSGLTLQRPQADTLAVADILFLVGGCLLAYELAKSPKGAAQALDEEAPETIGSDDADAEGDPEAQP